MLFQSLPADFQAHALLGTTCMSGLCNPHLLYLMLRAPMALCLQMYALLAICTAMCPTANRLLDEAVTNTLREK